MATKQIILAAGGTGGHMMPAEALSAELVSRGYSIVLVTDDRGARYADGFHCSEKYLLNTSSHMQGGILGKIKSVFSILKSTRLVAQRFYHDWDASCVIGFGGYPSMPTILAGAKLGIPIILHEQNSVLGRVNRWMADKSGLIALGFEDTQRIPVGVKTVFVGNPVRQSILNTSHHEEPQDGLHIAVLGGSQGARILSDIVPEAIANAAAAGHTVSVTHQARPEDVARVKEFYMTAGIEADVDSYFADMAELLAKTSLVIARSGASTIAELIVTKTPSVLVPLKIAADNHQYYNALSLQQIGGAEMLDEDAFTVDALTSLLNTFAGDKEAILRQREVLETISLDDATTRLADAVESMLNNTAQVQSEKGIH